MNGNWFLYPVNGLFNRVTQDIVIIVFGDDDDDGDDMPIYNNCVFGSWESIWKKNSGLNVGKINSCLILLSRVDT